MKGYYVIMCDLFEVGTFEEVCQFDSDYSSKKFLKKIHLIRLEVKSESR